MPCSQSSLSNLALSASPRCWWISSTSRRAIASRPTLISRRKPAWRPISSGPRCSFWRTAVPSFARTSPALPPAKSSASSIPPPPSYPAPLWGRGGSPTLGQRGEPQQPGHQNLRRIPRIQGSQIALAKAESARRDERKRHGECGSASARELAGAAVVGPEQRNRRREATRDDPRSPRTAPAARAKGIERAVGNRPGDALERADDPDCRTQTPEKDEEEGEWTL